MKKVLLFLPIFTFYFSFAQSSDVFIEVIAEDTVRLEADEIIFTINFPREDDFYGTSVDSIATNDHTNKLPLVKKVDKKDSYSELLLLIKQFHIDTLPAANLLITTEYNYGRFAHRSIQLKFYSKTTLERFLSKANQIKNIIGYISSSTSKKEKEGGERLLEKLLSIAKKDADNIAKLSGKSIGKLLQVKQMEELPGGWTVYPPLSALGQSGEMLDTVSSDIINGIIVLRKKLTVRYEWN
jgi:hypothetical protein